LGVQVIDISNPDSPRPVGGMDSPDWVEHLTVEDGMVFLADGRSGLLMLPAQ
jgi:hypothetical protein